jgi:hypothetical protein
MSRGGLSRDRLGSSRRCRDGPFRAAEAGGTLERRNATTKTKTRVASRGESSPHTDIDYSTIVCITVT